MPDPSNYDDHDSWMAACVPALIGEGREQDQAVAICSSMWSNKSAEVFEGAIFKTREDILHLVQPKKVRLIRDE